MYKFSYDVVVIIDEHLIQSGLEYTDSWTFEPVRHTNLVKYDVKYEDRVYTMEFYHETTKNGDAINEIEEFIDAEVKTGAMDDWFYEQIQNILRDEGKMPPCPWE